LGRGSGVPPTRGGEIEPGPGSVVLGDHLTAVAGAQGLQGGQRDAVAQKVDRAVREDDIRSAPVAATVRPVPFVLQVAAWQASASKRPGYVRRRELPVDWRRGIPPTIIKIPPCRHLAHVILVIARWVHALVAERLPQGVAVVGLTEQYRGASAIGDVSN